MQAEVAGYGKVWYHPKAIANVCSLARVADKYRVQYDSNIEDAFTLGEAIDSASAALNGLASQSYLLPKYPSIGESKAQLLSYCLNCLIT